MLDECAVVMRDRFTGGEREELDIVGQYFLRSLNDRCIEAQQPDWDRETLRCTERGVGGASRAVRRSLMGYSE
jgi:hypothetical protein